MTSCLHPLCDPERIIASTVFYNLIVLSVVLAEGERPVPSRTRKLSPPAPMVLHSTGCGRVGHRRHQTRNNGGEAFASPPFSCPPAVGRCRAPASTGRGFVSLCSEYGGWDRSRR